MVGSRVVTQDGSDNQSADFCGEPMTNFVRVFVVLAAVFAPSARSYAQSPHTAAVVVAVTDQTGAAVPGAQVSIANDAGTARDGTTGNDGSVTIAALPVVGIYGVGVSKEGFSTEGITNVLLRAGETATVRVRLMPTGGTSEVTVYGTAQGVRADPEIGTRLASEQIDVIPLLGRRISALPLMDSAFRPANGTGDLFLSSGFFVTGAGGRRQADFVVDGATGDEPWGRQMMFSTLPRGAVQAMNILSRAFSAEFGWTSGPAINIVTKSGSNTRRGELLVLGRPGGPQSSSLSTDAHCPPSLSTCVPPVTAGVMAPSIPPNTPDSLLQGSFAIGGAITPDRTHYFAAGDFTRQDRTAAITTPLVPPGTTTVGHYRQGLLNVRVDHRLRGPEMVMLRVNVDRFSDSNPQDVVSGNVLPSAGQRFTRHAGGFQLNDTTIISPAMVNEARFEFQNASPVTSFDPLTPSTQFTRVGAVPFTSAESRSVRVFSRVAQLSNTLTWTREKHDIRMGGNITQNTSGGDGTEFGNAFVLGQFTVNPATTVPPERLVLADMQRYQQSFNFGAGTYEQGQWLFALFAQDTYRARSDVTVNAGIRYDRQTFADGSNLAPRIGFGWNPLGDPKTAVRGGYGFYYTQLRASLDADFEIDGPQGIFTYQAAPGQAGFPTCLTCTPVAFNANAARGTLPARSITIRPGRADFYSQFFNIAQLVDYSAATFENPRSQVGSLGIERELTPRLFVAVDYVKQHWTDLDRLVDLNAPAFFLRTLPGQVRTVAAADATRPIAPVNGGFRQINVIENLGTADYDGLQMTARWWNEKMFTSFSYTVSKATNTTEPDGSLTTGPNDYNQLLEEERGPSSLDQRHRAVFTFTYRLPYDLLIGTVSQFGSALPFNAITGVDNNGDGVFNDRPVVNGRVLGRNALRGTATSDVAIFGEGKLLTGPRPAMVRIEVFNLFNHANILGRNGTFGNAPAPLPSFGLALPGLGNIEPGRMVQLQLRYSF